MKIKLVSDLHLEFSDIDISNNEGADVLILSGDILLAEDLYKSFDFEYDPTIHGPLENLEGSRYRGVIFRNFLKRCSSYYPHVVYVAGNHEFYRGKWVGSIQNLRDECARYPNIYFLECDTKTIDDVVFVGGTLWTDMNRGDPLTMHTVGNGINDFRSIRNDTKGYTKLKPADAASRHKKTLQYIDQVLDKNKDKTCVVVGHHGPSHLSVHPQHASEHLMNGAYHSDLSEFVLSHPQIKLWTVGHTHHAHWYYIGDSLIACNPRGYQSARVKEHTGWNPNFIIDLDAMPEKDYVSNNYSNLSYEMD